jgi:hypothetical protein
MAEIGVDQTIPLCRVPLRRLTDGPRCLTGLARLAASTPCRRRLGYPQRTVADGKESGRRSCEQKRSCQGGNKAADSYRVQEPEAEGTEQYDEESDDEDERVPGTLAAVPVEVERDFSPGKDGQEQACPHQGGVLVAVEGLGGEIAGHAV